MKKVDTTYVAAGAAIKFKSGIIDHYNAAILETGKYQGINAVGDGYTSAGTCYVMHGLVNSGSGLNYVISEGVILLGGELHLVPAQSITVTAGQVPVITQTSNYTTGTNADPFSFEDGTTHNILLDRKANFTAATAASSYLEFDNLIRVNGSTVPTLTANYSTGLSSTPTLIRKGSRVQGKGVIACGASAATGQTITTVDASFRPSVTRMLNVVITDNGGNFKYAKVVLTTGGALSIDQVSPISSINGYFLSLDNLSYNV